jgi:SAM-dependent methyltransferase
MQFKDNIKNKLLLKLIRFLKPSNEINKHLIKELFSGLQSSEKDWITRVSIENIKAVNSFKGELSIYLREVQGLIEPEERFLIPAFEKGSGRESDRFSYQKKFINFNIKAGGKVLDVGSGNDPFPLATHLADLHEGETMHRARPLIKDGREFRVCDIGSMPYKDKEFDFVYCSHVLEHVSDPAKACEEIMRVGKRGYIETPTRTSDIMLNFTRLPGHHKWHINLLGHTLIFMEYADRELRDTGLNDFFYLLHSNYKNPFQTLMNLHRDLCVNMLLWEGGFKYCVFDKTGRLVASNREDNG